MGKADFKKINDRWCTDEDSSKKIEDFYLKDEPVRKKKKVKSSKKKADHKHIYKPVLLKEEWGSRHSWGLKQVPHYCLGEKCEICGKINLVKYFITEKREDGTFLNLTPEKVLEKYSELEIISWEGI